MTKFLNISVDNTLGGNSPSDVTVSSQKAIKDYVDAHSSGSPSWGSITGTLSNQTDLQNALSAKQDVLTAGTDIDITYNTVSLKKDGDTIVDNTSGQIRKSAPGLDGNHFSCSRHCIILYWNVSGP